jgi:3-hydroxyacyl-CoA dehydrogenase/enoyl-CoA hydratase/3-hydroxybutyryl-CoA epimerase
VHVIGAGVMGGDIAALAALRGMSVTLQDRSEELIQPAFARAKAYFDKRLREPQAAAEASGACVWTCSRRRRGGGGRGHRGHL